MNDWHDLETVPGHPLIAAAALLRWQVQQARMERLAMLRQTGVQHTKHRLRWTADRKRATVQWSPA